MSDPDLRRALVPTPRASRTAPRRSMTPRDVVLAVVRLGADGIARIVENHAGIVEGEPELEDAREWLRHLGDALYELAERATEAAGTVGGGEAIDVWAETAAKDKAMDGAA